MHESKRILFLSGYYVYAIHRGVADYAREAGWYLNASMVQTGIIPRGPTDGILTFSADRPDIVAAVRQHGVPTVEMFNGRELADLPRVLLDNHAIGAMAGRYLVSRGFEHIGYYFCDPSRANILNEMERSEGLRQVVVAAGRRFHAVTEEHLIAQLATLPRPIALMCQNAVVGTRVIDTLLRHGIRIPAEVAIIGVDNGSLYHHTAGISQTCVDSNEISQGYQAARLLDAMLNGGIPPTGDVQIPATQVVEYASTNCFATPHPATNKALAYMQAHCAEPLTTEMIARHAGMSSYQLNRYFKRHLGESISRSLLGMRLRKAMAMLANSEEKIEIVAMECGFRHDAYFSRVFHRETGQTPSAFRAKAKTHAG